MSSNPEQIKKILVLLVIFAIIWLVYNNIFKVKNNGYPSDTKILDVPYSIKCFFNEPGCEEGNIDGWSVVHLLVCFIIGMFFPNRFLVIIIFSVAFEIIGSRLGKQPRYIINPLINITGYAIGSLMSFRNDNYKEKYQVLIK